MMRQNSGHIINIASAAGHIPNVNQSVYASSKWAVVGWSESVRLELQKDKYNINVTTVCPSYINTGMFPSYFLVLDDVGFQFFGRWSTGCF
jgi:short-subunit dehydrogenase